ncbi:MAG: hypothetical protein EHM48_07090 [Planctomycetaceae bacterium]|nr:MAG: hypothetical protein EHM48_07090 [Planctomycetaceae bacterium]
MKATQAFLAIAAMWTFAITVQVDAQVASQPADAPAPQAASAPAAGETATSRPADQTPDYVKDLIDTYDAGAERIKFYQAAGASSELTEEKFDAAVGKVNSFVRPYDRWSAMAAYDKNHKGSVDSFQAADYRADLRKKTLERFDKDKDGKLAGDERAAANRWLAGGGATTKPAGNGAKLADMLKKRSADATLTDEERDALMKEIADEQQRQMLEKYDTNADGKLDDDERKAMQADERAKNGEFVKKLEAIKLRQFDTDGDGKLSEAEEAEFKEFQKQFEQVGKDFDLSLNDRDGDGKVSDEERKLAAEEWKKASLKLIAKTMRYIDVEGKGQITIEDRQAFQQKVQEGTLKWFEDFIAGYSQSGSDRLTKTERADFVQGLKDDLAERRTKFDADKDGRLNPDETINMLEAYLKEIGIEPAKTKATTQPAQ